MRKAIVIIIIFACLFLFSIIFIVQGKSDNPITGFAVADAVSMKQNSDNPAESIVKAEPVDTSSVKHLGMSVQIVG